MKGATQTKNVQGTNVFGVLLKQCQVLSLTQ